MDEWLGDLMQARDGDVGVQTTRPRDEDVEAWKKELEDSERAAREKYPHLFNDDPSD